VFRGKTGTESYLAMSNRVHRVLDRRSQNKLHPRWVFPNRACTNHRSLNTTYLNELIKKAGVNKTVHEIRHGYTTKMLKSGMTLNDVRLLLGHASIQTTQRYQHLETSDVSPKAAEILNAREVEKNRLKIKAV